ncbi:MAG: hypothetical protein WAU01_06065, partial [Saprospiraceae bacterium]
MIPTLKLTKIWVVISVYAVCIFLSSHGLSQNIFKHGYDQANPIKNNAEFTIEQRLNLHLEFFDAALKEGNRTKIFYAYLFLQSDYMRNQDYATANDYLLKADSIAQLTNEKTWIGHMHHRKAVMALRLEKNDKAILQYLASIPLCGDGKDSLCIGEAFEQL